MRRREPDRSPSSGGGSHAGGRTGDDDGRGPRARLPAIADGDAALGDLYDLVRGRLVRDGREAAFTAYATNPDNNALVQDLLRHAAETDAAFAAALLDAVDRAQLTAPAPPGRAA